MKAIITLLTLFIGLNSFNAQNFILKGKIPDLVDSTIYLANYNGKNLYYYDTAIVSKKGTFEFKRDSIKYGLYALVLSPQNYFEIIINEPYIEFNTTASNTVKDLKIIKSEENIRFMEFKQYMASNGKQHAELSKKYKTLSPTDKEYNDLRDQLIELENGVSNKRQYYIKNHPDLLFSKYASLLEDVELPETIRTKEGVVLDSVGAYQYYKNHFLDAIDFSDDRFVRCQFYHNKIDKFFSTIVVQHPDSILSEAYHILDQMDYKGDMFRYTLSYLITKYQEVKIMGMDEVVCRLGLKYFKTGIAYWVKKDKLKEFVDHCEVVQYILIDEKAPQLVLLDLDKDETMEWVDIYKIDSPYTLLVFYSPTCGKCKKEMPKLNRMKDSILGDMGVEIVAISTELDNSDTKAFIKKHQLDFINLSDNMELHNDPSPFVHKGLTNEKSVNFRHHYDIFGTPKTFLLDKDKVIKAKDFDVEQLPLILEGMSKRKN